ncbi:hypothetical protein HZ326_20236 [Fusarium oxysporum f. sp. albedinis]|nr:hypothetical protein FOMA001_g3635 [Fusarium oxysporum f. sp. matthiolae]KAJ0136755.1 hypothetical protein HZ326_20236 [Fusarium oxysporum f. sp. albedinis]KAK2480816.1 hypothetical protein H9L39_06455 [Fusarium oxysporum f. sp. albedinis]
MIKPALDHMPPEILADICWYLCSHCTNDHLSHYPQPNSLATPKPGKLWGKQSAEDTTGLLSLARTCRVLNEAATPYIYHNIDARGWPEEKITEFLRDRRQLQERSFVRRLTYEVDPFPLYTLLCRMPGLQLLSLVDRGNSFGQTLASEAHKKLHDLRYLHLKTTHSKAVRDLSTLENLFEMAPNIKTLVIESHHLEWKTDPEDPLTMPLANLTCLKLFNVSVDPSIIEGILEKCGPLESFIYICQPAWSVTPSNLLFALDKSSSTLRYLECCWHSINSAPMLSLLLRSLETVERLQTLVLGGDSLFIGMSCEDEATHTFTVKTLDPASLVELLPASIVEVRIDSKHLHGGMYKPMLALGQAKQAGSFPELRSFLQSNFDVSVVPYTLRDLSELSERYGISFQQETGPIFPPPVACPRRAVIRPGRMRRHPAALHPHAP